MKVMSLNNCVKRGIGRVFSSLEHQFVYWYETEKPAFDAFSEYEPDIFICSLNELSRATVKNLVARPKTKVIYKVPEWNSLGDAEKEAVINLKSKYNIPNFAFSNSDMPIHDWEIYANIKCIWLPNAVDIFDFAQAKFDDSLATDLCFVGNHSNERFEILSKYLNKNSSVKLFGKTAWRLPYYLGYLEDNEIKNAYASAKVSLNLETRSNYISERPFNILAAGGVCLSTDSDTTRKLFGNRIRYTEDSQDSYTKEENQEYVLTSQTYFDRMLKPLSLLELSDDTSKLPELKSKILNRKI
jgi:spore maturation protein CgeB